MLWSDKLIASSLSLYSSPFLTSGWREIYQQAQSVVHVSELVVVYVDFKTFAVSGAS